MEIDSPPPRRLSRGGMEFRDGGRAGGKEAIGGGGEREGLEWREIKISLRGRFACCSQASTSDPFLGIGTIIFVSSFPEQLRNAKLLHPPLSVGLLQFTQSLAIHVFFSVALAQHCRSHLAIPTG